MLNDCSPSTVCARDDPLASRRRLDDIRWKANILCIRSPQMRRHAGYCLCMPVVAKVTWYGGEGVSSRSGRPRSIAKVAFSRRNGSTPRARERRSNYYCGDDNHSRPNGHSPRRSESSHLPRATVRSERFRYCTTCPSGCFKRTSRCRIIGTTITLGHSDLTNHAGVSGKIEQCSIALREVALNDGEDSWHDYRSTNPFRFDEARLTGAHSPSMWRSESAASASSVPEKAARSTNLGAILAFQRWLHDSRNRLPIPGRARPLETMVSLRAA